MFDRNGNIGPTVWADGRIVGAWAQLPDGSIAWRFLHEVGRKRSDQLPHRRRNSPTGSATPASPPATARRWSGSSSADKGATGPSDTIHIRVTTGGAELRHVGSRVMCLAAFEHRVIVYYKITGGARRRFLAGLRRNHSNRWFPEVKGGRWPAGVALLRYYWRRVRRREIIPVGQAPRLVSWHG
ncbi:hypothetical protein GCM10012275_22590 [Longimycelium tulufanense]|uniref:Uncharacterized protein n=1 Tax=Longimycelium tulufanense TaxID=907463 RepID=A0A8J3CF30_9PSEU|nr:hypothetical protein GCM10012275_22590 [Longimycelium tulufanense]